MNTSCVISINLHSNLLITGGTGQGKTTILSHILKDLISNNTPNELSLFLVSTNPVSLLPFQKLPHLRQAIINDPKAFPALLDSLIEEAKARRKLLKESKINSASEYNEKYPGKMPSILVAIDEIADIIVANDNIPSRLAQFFEDYQSDTDIHFIIGITTSGNYSKWLAPELLPYLSVNKILLAPTNPWAYKIFPEINASEMDFSFIDWNRRRAYYYDESAKEKLTSFEFNDFEE